MILKYDQISQTVAPIQANGLAKQTPWYPSNPGKVNATIVRITNSMTPANIGTTVFPSP